MQKKKQKIAIIGIRGIPANYGGFETCAEKTAERFAKHFDVYVFCRSHNCQYKGDSYKGAKLIKLPSLNTKSFDTLSHTFVCVLYLIFKPSIRLVHLYNTANAIYIPLLQLFGKKVVVSVDGLEWKRPKWGKIACKYYKIAEVICSRLANIIIFDSVVIQNYYKHKFNYTKGAYIPYGVDDMKPGDESILEKYNLKKREYFLFVGRLVPDKAVDRLVTAFKQVQTDKQLVIIGDDIYQREYIARVKKLADDRIKFLGFLYGEEYATLNKHSYAYVSASYIEGTSPALINAMGAGNCVLVNGIQENIETLGGAGLYYEENNEEDLIRKFNTILNDQKLVQDMRSAAYQRVQTVYTWDIVAKKYMDVFAGLLNGNKNTA